MHFTVTEEIAGSSPVRSAIALKRIQIDFCTYLLYNIIITLDNNNDNLPNM